MNLKKATSLLAITLLSVGVLSGCGHTPQAQKDTTKPLQVCTNATFVPFEFKDDANATEYKGFEMDLLQAVSKEMGQPVALNNVPFAGIIPALQQGTMDLGASGITLSPERAEKVAFSAPFYESKLVLMVPASGSIHSINDLKNKTVAVQMGTTAADYCDSKKLATKQFDHNSEVIMELQVGGSPAGILDKPVADYYLTKEGKGKFKIIDLPDAKGEYLAFAMNKNNPQLQKDIDAALLKLKKNGTFQKIYQKWFGTNCPNFPDSAAAALAQTAK